MISMSLEQLYSYWLNEFTYAEIDAEIAKEEFDTWAECLGGEFDNEYIQNSFSVSAAAKEAINELN